MDNRYQPLIGRKGDANLNLWTAHPGRSFVVLLGLGGLVLLPLTTIFFEAIGLPPENFIMVWVGYSGLLGLPIVH